MASSTLAERPLPVFRHIPKFRYESPPKKVEDVGEESTTTMVANAEAETLTALYDKLHWTVNDVGFPPWVLDVESPDGLSALGTREPSNNSESPDPSEVSACDSPKSVDHAQCCSEVEMELPPLQRQDLEEAYDEAVDAPIPGDGGPFQWSSMKDAARAAWAGGTDLLRYWEVLPQGAAKALARLREGAPNRPALALELGMGRGRLAMQIFLSGASVIGVEFAAERYHRALAACERLAHRRPEMFTVSKGQGVMGPTVLLKNMLPGNWGGAMYEARRGDFCSALSKSEVQSATVVILQVHIPENFKRRICNLLSLISVGCRILSRSDLWDVWLPGELFPFKSLGRCRVATSWAPIRGHDMYVWEKVDSTST